jgi:CBS domain-containing protein
MDEFRSITLHALPGLVRYFEPCQELPGKILDRSPAVLAMTDLRQQVAITIEAGVSVEYAMQRMKTAGVRLLFVVNADKEIVGLITATDILGEKPQQFRQELHLRHEEITVLDIMTRYSALDVLYMEDVLRARVGDIVATLKKVGRQHALVLDNDPHTGRPAIRGIFSLSQISRQLGQAIDSPDVARSFAELEVALNN